MKARSIISMAMALCIAGAMTGCGDSSKDSDKITEKDVEQALENFDNNSSDSKNKGENTNSSEEAAAPEEVSYAPTQEIQDAKLSSGLVQIGNDIFHNGGYYTVDQFIKEFGDRYDMSELNPDGLIEWGGGKSVKLASLSDPDLIINVKYDFPNTEEEKVRVGEAIVASVFPAKVNNNFWYPGAVRSDADGYDFYNISEFYENNGFVSVDEDNEVYKYGVYWEKNTMTKDVHAIMAREKGSEENLYGNFPIYDYYFTYSLEDTKAFDFTCNVYYSFYYSGDELNKFTPVNG